jgi:precorrin-6B methylase 2
VVKGLYVSGVRGVRSGLDSAGLLAPLDRWAERSRAGAWTRSLLAVYDLHDLIALDVPWWTYDSAERVARFLGARPDARVLEWGSGASSVWLAKRAGSVTSIEHDPEWAEEIAPVLPANARVVAVPPTLASQSEAPIRSAKKGFEGLDFRDYVEAIDRQHGDFDLIVVDGRAREACLERAVERLAPGGVIVVDNVERARYRAAIEKLGTRVTVYWTAGLTPSLPYPTRTALLRLTA